jgi:hypothetical protein
MGHLTANEPWATIDLDTTEGRVFVQEDWYYKWNLWTGVSQPWTYQEKHAVHTLIDKQIWGTWSNRVRLGVTGTSAFAKKFLHSGVPMNFDARWDLKLPTNWTVTVWKMPPGASATGLHRSFVQHANRTIELNTADLRPRGAGNAAGQSTANFVTSPHEYGHTLGSPGSFPKDEYNAGNAGLADTGSLMNIGRQLRRHHIVEIIKSLNGLMPGTTFNANSLPA